MVEPTNKQTDVIYDILGDRFKYSLHVGTPPKRLLYRFANMMSEATKDAIEREIARNDCLGGICQYGYPVGTNDFRENLAKFLTKEYQSPVKKENLVMTSGASLSVVFMLNQLFPKKPPIYVEKISYFRTLAILHGHHYETRPIRIELDGIDCEDLERVWKKELGECKTKTEDYAAVLYLVPQYSNPSGVVLSQEKSKEVVRLARKYNVLVICDDVYNLHYFDGVIHKRLFAYDDENPDYKDFVVSNGSFSKLFMPSLRLGWVEAGPVVRRKCFERGAITCSGGSMNTFTGAIVSEILRSGKAHEHVKINREDAAKKMSLALKLLEKYLPPSCEVAVKPTGGYFLFVRLPINVNSTLAWKHLKTNHDVFVNDGRLFWTGDIDEDFAMCNGLRVAIPYLEEEHLTMAIKELCVGLSELCPEDPTGNQRG